MVSLRKSAAIFGLNPCFNGRYSTSLRHSCEWQVSFRLNPCFNGRYSTSLQRKNVTWWKRYKVLILVLMEDTLRDFILLGLAGGLLVLILVLMEDTLRAKTTTLL